MMATIINSAAGTIMGWKYHSKVLALPSSPKQQLVSLIIPSSSLKYNHFYHFSSRLLSTSHSHAILTTHCSLRQHEKDFLKFNYYPHVDGLFSAETNPNVGSCTTPCHRHNVIDSVGSCTPVSSS